MRNFRTISFKISVVDFMHDCNNIRKTGKMFKITNKMVRTYLKQENRLRESLSKRLYRKLVKYRAKYGDCEGLVMNWFHEQRNNKFAVSMYQIQDKMKEFVAENHPNEQFRASNGWFRNFCKRNKLVLRRITSSGRGLTEDSIEKIEKYIQTTNEIIESK